MGARGTFVAVALAAVLASAGVLPCVCDVAAAPRPAQHCHDDADGWRATAPPCACDCMSAAPRESAVPRAEAAAAGPVATAAHVALVTVVPFAWSAPRPSADPSPPHPRLILRI